MEEVHLRDQEDSESRDSNGSLGTSDLIMTCVDSPGAKEEEELCPIGNMDSERRGSTESPTAGHPFVISVVTIDTSPKRESDIKDKEDSEGMEGVPVVTSVFSLRFLSEEETGIKDESLERREGSKHPNTTGDMSTAGNEKSQRSGNITKRKAESMKVISSSDQGKAQAPELSFHRKQETALESVDRSVKLDQEPSKKKHSDVQEIAPELQRQYHRTECETTMECPRDPAHSREKPYNCTECKKCFNHETSLLSHKRSHPGHQKKLTFGDKPPQGKAYQCTRCEKAYQSKGSLDVHSRYHTGEKTYKCTECDKAFSHRKNLQSHQKIHTGIRIGADLDDYQPCSSSGISKEHNSPSPEKKSEAQKSGAKFYKTKFSMSWIEAEPFKGVIVPVENDVYSFRCLVCEKKVSCSHQGEFDVRRHITGKIHTALQKEHLPSKTVSALSAKKPSREDSLARDAEIKLAEFLAQHNVPLAAADHLDSLIKTCFPDSKIAQSVSCRTPEASCILNDPVALGLFSDLVEDMKSSTFSLCVGGSTAQDTEAMNPVVVRIFDFKQRMARCKFLDMCLSKASTADGVFTAVSDAMEKHAIPWDNCIGFGMDGVSGNAGKDSAIKTRIRALNSNIYFMACPCHKAHSAASHAASAFCSRVKDFDVDELITDVYYWLDYSSKQKYLDAELSQLVDSDYRRMLKFMSVQWLGIATCLDRLILQFDALRSLILSTRDIDRASKGRLRRLVQCFESPMTEIYCLFFQASLPAFVHFNLLLQREDPVIHLLYDAMIDLVVLLLSRAFRVKVVHSFKRNPDDALPDLSSEDCQIPDSSLYVGILVRGKLKNMLEGGDIDTRKQSDFFEAVRSFHHAAVTYALKALPIHDEVLKHARVFNIFEKQKHGYESVLFMVERFNAYLKFTNQDLTYLEQEFVNYQVTDFEDLPAKAREEAAIRVSCSSAEVVSYRMDVIWFHLERGFLIQGTVRSKFFRLSKIARLIFTLPHSNADEERVLSRVTKIKRKCNLSGSLDRTLSSILMVQMNKPSSKPGSGSSPPEHVREKARSVTVDYNKAHGSAH